MWCAITKSVVLFTYWLSPQCFPLPLPDIAVVLVWYGFLRSAWGPCTTSTQPLLATLFLSLTSSFGQGSKYWTSFFLPSWSKSRLLLCLLTITCARLKNDVHEKFKRLEEPMVSNPLGVTEQLLISGESMWLYEALSPSLMSRSYSLGNWGRDMTWFFLGHGICSYTPRGQFFAELLLWLTDAPSLSAAEVCLILLHQRPSESNSAQWDIQTQFLCYIYSVTWLMCECGSF